MKKLDKMSQINGQSPVFPKKSTLLKARVADEEEVKKEKYAKSKKS